MLPQILHWSWLLLGCHSITSSLTRRLHRPSKSPGETWNHYPFDFNENSSTLIHWLKQCWLTECLFSLRQWFEATSGHCFRLCLYCIWLRNFEDCSWSSLDGSRCSVCAIRPLIFMELKLISLSPVCLSTRKPKSKRVLTWSVFIKLLAFLLIVFLSSWVPLGREFKLPSKTSNFLSFPEFQKLIWSFFRVGFWKRSTTFTATSLYFFPWLK